MQETIKKPIVTIEMEDGGIIKLELYPSKAPETVNNFIFRFFPISDIIF